jgi:rfaE bifunctional protein nucleotidyltransferase chain/domain
MTLTNGNSTNDKIKTLSDLRGLLTELKRNGSRLVHCHGVFDLVHPGHIRHLETAKQQGDVLIVTVTPDRYVGKGPGRPVFNERLRAETLAALQCVDFVAVNEWPTAVETIHLLQPDVYVKGSDYAAREKDLTGKIYEEEEAIQKVGGEIHFTEDITFSSTHLLNAHFEVFPPDVWEYLRDFRQKFTVDNVIDHLRSLWGLKVLVIGEAIIDEYHFCRAYGMASKSTSIAAQYVDAECYAGGALAVANHVAGFCERVDLITCLGTVDSRHDFVLEHLKPNVTPRMFFRADAPTVIKRRFVNQYLVTKLFEVSYFNDRPLPSEVEYEIGQHLSSVIETYDLVLVADFGHGFVTNGLVDLISGKAKFLAVNTQTNSINMGFNIVTRYPRVDYVCIDEEEIRMACRDRFGPVEELMERIASRLACRLMTVTRGHHGSVSYREQEGFAATPVFSREVVDTIGAGDAVLAVTAPCAKMGFSPDLIGFIGNAVGALAVRTIGNKEAVDPVAVNRFITTLLK